MAYGTENEINTTATFVHVVMPVLTPTDVFQEEGYIVKSLLDSKFAVMKYTEQVE
jgi:hypothetical protein